MKTNKDMIKVAQRALKLAMDKQLSPAELDSFTRNIGVQIKGAKEQVVYQKFQSDHSAIEFFEGK